MQIDFCKGTEADVPAIGALYREAIAFMAANGLDQWQTGYPNEEDALSDVKNGFSRVLKEKEKVIAICAILPYEPDYERIDGAWQGTSYLAVHRVAVLGAYKGKGYAGRLFSEAEKEARKRGVSALRIDTHEDNKPMRSALEKSGFRDRGIIYLQRDGAPRVAYEKLL